MKMKLSSSTLAALSAIIFTLSNLALGALVIEALASHALVATNLAGVSVAEKGHLPPPLLATSESHH